MTDLEAAREAMRAYREYRRSKGLPVSDWWIQKVKKGLDAPNHVSQWQPEGLTTRVHQSHLAKIPPRPDWRQGRTSDYQKDD